MESGAALKLVLFLLWPFLLIFLYFLFDRKGFKKQWEKFKENGFFMDNSENK